MLSDIWSSLDFRSTSRGQGNGERLNIDDILERALANPPLLPDGTAPPVLYLINGLTQREPTRVETPRLILRGDLLNEGEGAANVQNEVLSSENGNEPLQESKEEVHEELLVLNCDASVAESAEISDKLATEQLETVLETTEVQSINQPCDTDLLPTEPHLENTADQQQDITESNKSEDKQDDSNENDIRGNSEEETPQPAAGSDQSVGQLDTDIEHSEEDQGNAKAETLDLVSNTSEKAEVVEAEKDEGSSQVTAPTE